jgi:hypothetical protein
MVPRPVTKADHSRAREFAKTDLKAVIKDVKSQLKSPLGDRHPFALIRYRALGKAGNHPAIEDPAGERLALTDSTRESEPATLHLLSMLPTTIRRDQVMLVRFHHELDSQRLHAKPLSIITENEIIRLAY